METQNSMRKSSAPSPQSDPDQLCDAGGGTLEFPVAPEFISRPPQIDPQVMLQRIAETMPWRSTRPGEKERRFEQAIHAEFVL